MKKILIITAIVIFAGMFIGCGSEEAASWFLDESKIVVKVDPCTDDTPEEPVKPTIDCAKKPTLPECQINFEDDPGFPMMKGEDMIVTEGGPGGAGAPIRYSRIPGGPGGAGVYANVFKSNGGPGGAGAPMRSFSIDGSEDCLVYNIEASEGATNANAPLTITVAEDIALNADLDGAFKLSLEVYGQFETTITLVDIETGATLKSVTKTF